MNAKMISFTVTSWPRVQMNVARTRASVKLDTLEMDLIVIPIQVRRVEKQLEILITRDFDCKLAFFSNCEKHF